MRRLIGATRPKSTGGGGGRQSSMMLGPAPASSMSSLSSSSLEGGEGEEYEAAAGSGPGIVGAAAAYAEAQEEVDEDGPGVFFGHMGVDSTQEVVWAESPKFYRPLARQPGGGGTDALVQRELSLIHGLLGDKENGGGGNGDGAGGAAASASQASLAQQQSLEAAKTAVAAKGGWRSDDIDEEEGDGDGDRQHAGPGETQQDEEEDDDEKEGQGQGQGQGKPKKGGFSSAILRSLLFRKSPAPSKRSRAEAAHDAAPAKKSGGGSSSMPPPPTPHRSPGGTRKRPRPNQEGGGSSSSSSSSAAVAASTDARPVAGGEQAATGAGQGVGMSLLGGLARSLKQGRFKLGLWQQPSASPPDAPATATAGQDGGKQLAAASSAVAAAAAAAAVNAAARDQKQDGKGDDAAAEGGEGREGEGKPKAREQQRNFLQLLQKIDEKLSQSEEGGMDESRSLQDGEAMDAASDGGQSQTPAPPADAQARPVEPPAPPAPAPAALVAPAPAPVAAPPMAPSMPPPPPPPPPATLAEQQARAPHQQAPPPQQAAPSSQPWEEDDSGMWTESDWDKILELTQAPAGTTAAAPAAEPAAPAPAQASQVSQPPPSPALPSQPVASVTAQSGSAPQLESKPAPPTEAEATGADTTPAAPSAPAAPAPNPPARPHAVSAQEPEEGGDARGAAFIPTEPAASYDRYEVLEVRKDGQGQGKEASVRHQATGWEGTLAIGSPWDECEVGKGDIVHVFGTDAGEAAGAAAGPRHRTVVDRDRNFLIVHPDVLISPSAIISGVECERRAVLQDGISSSAYQSPVAVLGNIKHTMTQNALLLLNDRERALPQLRDGSIVGELERVADSVLARHRVELHGMAIPEADARQQLLDLIRPIVDWARLHYLPDAAAAGQAQQQQRAGPVVHVERTEGVEENIWSAGLGLKGMIDATLLARPLDPSLQQQQLQQQLQPGGASGLFPLELKSGSNSAQLQLLHRAQVMLYSLLLRDRYGPNPDSVGEGAAVGTGAAGGGVLAYVTAKGVEVHPVPPKANELLRLLIVRNRVAQALVRANQLRGQGNGKNGRGRKRRTPCDEEGQQGGAAAAAAEGAEEGQQEPEQDLAALGAAAALPSVLANHSACSRCFQVAECMVFHRALEGGDAHSSALGGLFGEITGELDVVDLAYLRKWETLVGLEAGACSQLGRDLWHRRGAVEEERTARTMGDMVCVDVEARNGLDGPSFLYRFARRKWADPSLSSQTNVAVPRPLHDLAMAVGDRVLISTESTLPRGSRDRHALRPFRHINMGAGTAVTVAEAYCDVLCSKALAIPGYPGFPFLLPPREPAGSGAAAATLAYEQEEDEEGGAAGANGLTMSGTSPSPRALEVVFRLDRDQSALSFALMRYNLVRLFTGPAENINAAVPGQPRRANGGGGGGGLRLAPTQGDLKRRRLVVHLDTPKFTRPPLPDPAQAASLLYTFGPQPPAGCHAEQLREEFARLNRDQQAAVEKVLTAKDYALLLGMPGTGKTWTIAFVVRALLCTGKSVLVTSYTHTAVDTLLLKLRECGVPFLRLGRASQVNPALHDSLLEAGGALASSAALEARLSQAKVMGATCLGIRHPALTQRKFDVCIVDEAGQILEPVCLGPLRSATSFVLVGDDNQLPPLVVSGAAQEGGMADSLFSRLARAHPNAMQRLTFQYRMNRDIMSVCNSLVYDNQLQCGDEGVAGATLVVPHPERLAALRAPVPADEVDPSWLERCLEPQRAVVFLDTDGISPDPLEDGLVPQGASDRDRDCPSNLTNPTEVRLVGQLVTALVVAGLRPEKLAVISPLRSQLKRLKRDLAHIRRLEINTVDKLQGTDRDCIIISMVRSNPDGRIGDLLQDRRRINVAVSRAKKKLIIVGSAGTLVKAGATGDLVTLMQQRGWLLRLPAQAHLAYDERGLDVVSLLSYTQQ